MWASGRGPMRPAPRSSGTPISFYRAAGGGALPRRLRAAPAVARSRPRSRRPRASSAGTAQEDPTAVTSAKAQAIDSMPFAMLNGKTTGRHVPALAQVHGGGGRHRQALPRAHAAGRPPDRHGRPSCSWPTARRRSAGRSDDMKAPRRLVASPNIVTAGGLLHRDHLELAEHLDDGAVALRPWPGHPSDP